MPTECSRDLFGFEAVEGRQVVAAFDGGPVTSDAGALLLGAANRAIGLVQRLARCFADGRCQELIEHTVEDLLAQRVYALALGYEDLNDHDDLRRDPLLATVVGKLDGAAAPDRAPLAGKSTLNRLELTPVGPTASRYKKIGSDPRRRTALRDALPPGPLASRRSGSSSTSTPPTTRSTAIRSAASSTATTRTIAICRCTSSAAITCWRPSCGRPTSTPRPGR